METENCFSNTNAIYGKSMKRLHSAGVLRREDILNNFPPETVAKVWEVFCKFVNKNYQAGKGTMIPKFGVFTFNNAEVNLEGTTNQYSRDVRSRRPVFIVSSDFVEKLKPGIYTQNNGIVYYNQKKTDNMAHVKVNYAEMAFSQNMRKEDFQTALEHTIKFIGEAIMKGEFKNKEMPGLGVLQTRNNIIAVKFNEDFSEGVKTIPQKLVTTKKHVNLFMETNEKEGEGNGKTVKELPNVAKTLNKLRPKTAVVTKITQGGEKWLKENYGIDLAEIEENEDFHAENNINSEEKKTSINIINDIKVKTQKKLIKLEDLQIPTNILEAIYFHKGVLLNEMKAQDRQNSGIIKKFEFLSAFIRANVNPMLTSQTVNDIVNLYTSQTAETINYSKVMGILLKEIQNLLNFSKEMKSTLNKYNDKNYYNSKTDRSTLNSSAGLTQLGTVYNRKVELDEVYKEIKSIKIIYNKIKSKYYTSIDQNMSYAELANIFREFSIILPRDKLIKILKFIEVGDINSFSLGEFTRCLDNCKILATEMTSEEIISAFHKLKDVTYTLGGRNYIFSDGKATVNKQRFISLFKGKTHFSEEVLEAIFNFLTKTDRDFGLDDYQRHFEDSKKNQLNEEFEVKAIGIINKKIHEMTYHYDEYFNQLLSYKINRSENYLNVVDFHKGMLKEKFQFTAEELDYLFKMFDTKKDSIIDREEFKAVLTKVYKPLFKIQDIIKKNNLEVEDLMFKMNIDMEKNERFDFFKFKGKMKLLDSTFDHEFIRSLFDEIKIGSGETAYVDKNIFVNHFNVFKKEHFRNTNNEAFKQNFMQNIKQNCSYQEFKSMCEKFDKFNSGLLSRVDFCTIIQKVTSDFKDEDIMRFIRIASLFEDYKVKYPQFLDLIFYNNKEDTFTECVEALTKFLISECDKDIYTFFSKILSTEYSKPVGKVFIPNKSIQVITIDKMFEFVKNKLKVDVTKNIICKLDLDLDGKISINDLKGIISRYGDTSFFKYENSDKQLEVNIYPEEVMDERRFKQIVGDIKIAMKNKNITEIGLFHKLDSNRDGFVSHPEFCKGIEQIIQLAPSIKDKFFNYLDIRALGMVDSETFLKRFKEFKSNDVVVKNDWEIEENILKEFSNWVKRNKKLTGDELYAVLDFDCDGTINLSDFKRFIIENLGVSKNDLNDFKIERTMQQISLTKNINLGLADIKEYMNRSREGKEVEDKLKESMRIFSASSNLNSNKRNQDWIHEAIERLGLFLSENYDKIENFFEENSTKNSGKMKVEDFKRFIDKNYKCFEGFNFTSDEIVTIYTALDPHKKNYITLEDLNNKLASFEFYKKMHLDVKKFISENFVDGVEAFKYFKQEKVDQHNNNTTLTKKELFEGINNLFPKKYQTNTILRYLSKKFKNLENVNFSEFNFVFFDEVKHNEEVLSKQVNSFERIKSGKLSQRINTTRGKNEISSNGFFNPSTVQSNLSMPNSTRARSAFPSGNKGASKLALATPFDDDPLEKIRRIIHSSRFDFTNFFKMYELVSENGYMNQFEFRNMIKKLNIGLTSLEIDKIIAKSGKTREGKIHLKDFIKYVSAEDPNLIQFKKNLIQLLSEVKQMIYKYYTNPKLAFQFNDSDISKQMDFTKFKQILTDLYERENRNGPNFALMKNAFEYVDLRKDGVIDMNEWLKAFSMTESSLDHKANSGALKDLREWENSRDVTSLYLSIAKNKKIIKDKVKSLLIKQGQLFMIHADNLISALKEVLNNVNISKTQWKIIVSIADRERNSLIDFVLFMNLVEKSVKHQISHMKIK